MPHRMKEWMWCWKPHQLRQGHYKYAGKKLLAKLTPTVDDPFAQTDVNIEMVPGTDADVTEEDIKGLGDRTLI